MDFQKMAEYRNNHNPYARRLGIFVEEIGPGYAHGGVYFSMADTACGSAMASYGHMAVTMNASYNFFRSANPGDRLTAEAHEVKHGQTICVYDVRITDQNGALLGTGTFTFYQLEKAIDL